MNVGPSSEASAAIGFIMTLNEAQPLAEALAVLDGKLHSEHAADGGAHPLQRWQQPVIEALQSTVVQAVD